MNRLFNCILTTAFLLFQFASLAVAGTLDDYYLQQFGESKNGQLEKAVLLKSADFEGTAKCGMPLKKNLRRDWNLLEDSTQKVLAKQLAYPALLAEQSYISPSGKFMIHYTTTGSDAVPNFAWVQTVANTFDEVANKYSALGWQLAPTNNGQPYNIYLKDMAPQRYYGVTNSDTPIYNPNYPSAFSSWMEIDNNFTDSVYKPDIYSPTQSLQVTAAHEYHHAIQYGYNYYFEVWYAEATSTWMEDELYDGVNQLYSYITNWFVNSKLAIDIPDSTDTGGGYGRWIFNRYLAEKHNTSVVRNAWESLGNVSSAGGNDIYMTPVLENLLATSYQTSLGADFFGFAKRVYTRDWTTHTSELDKIHPYSPVATYSSYPAGSGVILPHYSFAYYRFSQPPSSITVTLAKSSGIQSAMFKNGTAIALNPDLASYTATGVTNSDELVLLIANTTNVDNHAANFSTDGVVAAVSEPSGEPYNPPASSNTTTTTTSSSSTGCFIATAAYGSYLHPQVQLLRNFRDDFLLTNAPGRLLVSLYYHYSPPLADFIARHSILRVLTRLILTPIILMITHPLIGITTLLCFGLLPLELRRRAKRNLQALEAVEV